ncbi:hypothetical protein GH714_011354 [Hevea brasiliensis]|uniref:Uncharacterized protein n=1 Tax=Hevea brasiliensis TaxID=3981 RepID=A0A6A6KKV0_HEVBR|nr:hypothetical protein GH714_011354 [Hevea brasiliensis]
MVGYYEKGTQVFIDGHGAKESKRCRPTGVGFKDTAQLMMVDSVQEVNEVDRVKMEFVRSHVEFDHCFSIDSKGGSDGLALLWDRNINISLISFSQFHVDIVVDSANGNPWRLIGFYGRPERGDFNDIRRQCEKRGRVPELDWFISNFHEAMEVCGFRDLVLEGH